MPSRSEKKERELLDLMSRLKHPVRPGYDRVSKSQGYLGKKEYNRNPNAYKEGMLPEIGTEG